MKLTIKYLKDAVFWVTDFTFCSNWDDSYLIVGLKFIMGFLGLLFVIVSLPLWGPVWALGRLINIIMRLEE